jgi:hypothetical protein
MIDVGAASTGVGITQNGFIVGGCMKFKSHQVIPATILLP